jgi:diguanylate cyclase (GGDEF)-like protein
MINNRSSFSELLRNAIARARRSKQRLAIMFVDLDGFKTVNDNFGHSVGDEILIAVANRLSARIRQSDILARWGGDEFTIILENVNRETAATLAQELLTEISHQFIVDGNYIYLTASIGISIYSGNAGNSETLLKNADTAMYYAKKTLGQNTSAFYTHELGEKTSKRSKHLIKLRQALENNEFHVQYQPKIDLNNSCTTGFEALLHWQPSDGEPVNPVEFIPLLETSGLIASVGEWVLRKSCTDIKSRQLDQEMPLMLSINISAQQFNQINFLDIVSQILTETNLDPRHLQFEIAESVFLQTKPNWHQSVKNLGVSLCLDDFGSGYSSLSYLRRYPLDFLKLNHSFIKDVGIDNGCSAIVVSTIELAHNLNIRVIANGVETKQQMEFLKKHHCDELQGFFLSKPLDISEIEGWEKSMTSSPVLQP